MSDPREYTPPPYVPKTEVARVIAALGRIKTIAEVGRDAIDRGLTTAAISASSTETLDADLQTVAQYVVERHVSEAPPENTGLPCPYCEQKLKRLDARREDDGTIRVQISARVQPKELLSMIGMLKGFAR